MLRDILIALIPLKHATQHNRLINLYSVMINYFKAWHGTVKKLSFFVFFFFFFVVVFFLTQTVSLPDSILALMRSRQISRE